MMPARDRRVLLALAGLCAALALVAAMAGIEAAVFGYVAPLVAVFVPLVLGRYPGERIIASLARRSVRPPRRRRSRGQARRPLFVLVPRGTALMARSLAVRPPPVASL